MIRVALKGLAGRKLRAMLTAFAIVLGVAMVSGTYVLTDTIKAGFGAVFTQVYKNADTVITGKSAIGGDANNGEAVPSFPESLLARVDALPEVQTAGGSVSDQAQLVGSNGKVLETHGAPTLAFGIDPKRARNGLNPLTLVEGRWPATDGEIAIDTAIAHKKHFQVGDSIGAIARGPVRTYRIVGVVKLGAASIGGATLAVFDLRVAQRLFHKPGRLDSIYAAAKQGVAPAKLVAAIRPLLPRTAQVLTGTAQARKDTQNAGDFTSILQDFLLAFGGIALFVGSFVIANTLGITIAQRTREFATLRTLGASRRQVLGSVVLEALVIGVLASITGLFAGLGLAKLLNALFVSFGIDLPKAGTVFATRTIVLSLVVGTLITLLASLRPALRATRVEPIAAVREGAVLPPGRFARLGRPGALATFALGVALLVLGSVDSSAATKTRLLEIGVGILVVFLGAAFVAAPLVRPIAAGGSPVATAALLMLFLLCFPIWILPYWLLRTAVFGGRGTAARIGAGVAGGVLNPLLLLVVLGMGLRRLVTGWQPEWPQAFPVPDPAPDIARLAERNARRNPQRTASTASALMIGLALVTAVAVLASGLKSRFESAVNELFVADYVVTSQNGFTPTSIASEQAVRGVAGVTVVSGVRAGRGKVLGDRTDITGVDPNVQQGINAKWIAGGTNPPAHLGANGFFVAKDYAKDHKLSIGSPLTLETPDGKRVDLVLRGIFDPPKGGSPYGTVTISSSLFDRIYPDPQDVFAFVNVRGGVTDANTKRLSDALASFPDAKIQTESQFKKSQERGIDTLLNLLYVLLSLSIVVSLFGIVNTLVLTVFERTRELGMLRAVGMTRMQVRRMIRHEAVVTALIGATLGIPIGIAIAALVGRAISFVAFTIPVGTIIVFVVAAIVAGILAAILPARRAARLNVLQALQYE